LGDAQQKILVSPGETYEKKKKGGEGGRILKPTHHPF